MMMTMVAMVGMEMMMMRTIMMMKADESAGVQRVYCQRRVQQTAEQGSIFFSSSSSSLLSLSSSLLSSLMLHHHIVESSYHQCCNITLNTISNPVSSFVECTAVYHPHPAFGPNSPTPSYPTPPVTAMMRHNNSRHTLSRMSNKFKSHLLQS